MTTDSIRLLSGRSTNVGLGICSVYMGRPSRQLAGSQPGTMFPFRVQSSWIILRAVSTVMPNWPAAKVTASRKSFPTLAMARVSAYAVRRSPARYTVLPGVSKRDQEERSVVPELRGMGFSGPWDDFAMR